jgi:hypothetical protein
MPTVSTFHEGELAVQERAGAAAQGRNSGRLISDAIIPGAIKFVSKQPMLIVGSVDQDDNLWTSILIGEPGFMEAELRTLDIDLARSLRLPGDPLWENLNHHSEVGLLVIDLRSRARLRVNGRVEFPSDDQLRINVEQAYPNCPQYIQRRNFRPAITTNPQPASLNSSGVELADELQQWLTTADTMFVSSRHPDHGVDASHRGGHPGFIRVLSPSRLRIPDYSGNGMFNTLGNFEVNPRAGILVPDFENGRTLQLTGRPEVLWNMDDAAGVTGGTRRYWDFTVDRWVQTENALPGVTEFLDYSPRNPGHSA